MSNITIRPVRPKSISVNPSSGTGKGGLQVITVDELPTVGRSDAMYLLKISEQGTDNRYTEWLYVNKGWERIGSDSGESYKLTEDDWNSIFNEEESNDE